MNARKTKEMRVNVKLEDRLKVDGLRIDQGESFVYLRRVVVAN